MSHLSPLPMAIGGLYISQRLPVEGEGEGGSVAREDEVVGLGVCM